MQSLLSLVTSYFINAVMQLLAMFFWGEELVIITNYFLMEGDGEDLVSFLLSLAWQYG